MKASEGFTPTKDYFNQLLQNKNVIEKSGWNISIKADKSSVRVLDQSQEKKIINKIKAVKKSGDTLGGTFITIATGVPVGLGKFYAIR